MYLYPHIRNNKIEYIVKIDMELKLILIEILIN